MLHPNRMVRGFAAVALALGLLATACGTDPVTDSTVASPSAPVDRQAMLDRALADLIRFNGPYETESDTTGAPDWPIDLNGPYPDEGAEEVPANVR